MSPLLPLLRLSGWRDFLLIDCEDSSQSELNARMEDGEPDVSWRAFSSYMEKNSKTQEQSRIVFREMLHTLKTDQEFLADFRYRNVTLMPALGIELEKAFHLRLPRCAAMLDAASQILAEERPSAVIATYETGPWARAIIIQASRAGIPTLGLQHGMIFDNHYDYMHRRVTVDPANNPIGFALPNVTCVWGPFWKEVLTESGHYPREAVAVTGNWRYDHISEMMTMDVQEAKRQLGFPADRRIVLVLSAGLNTLDFIRLCLETISKRPDCSPMIKLHPGSDSPGPVRELLSKLGFPLSILIEGRLHESILSADLVISQISTAVGEAALLNRPVVLANLENLAGAEAYVESGICLYATDPDQLAVAVGKGLDDAQTLGQLAQARKEFVSRYFYKLDGCASQRVAETLRQSIQAQGNG